MVIDEKKTFNPGVLANVIASINIKIGGQNWILPVDRILSTRFISLQANMLKIGQRLWKLCVLWAWMFATETLQNQEALNLVVVVLAALLLAYVVPGTHRLQSTTLLFAINQQDKK
jgi:hypothetical protein